MKISRDVLFESDLKFSFIHERSVAYVATTAIEKALKDNNSSNWKDVAVYSEMQLKFAEQNLNIIKESKESEFNSSVKLENKASFIPDAMIRYTGDNGEKLIFVEYKNGKKLEYSKLAIDYLKFKVYTNGFKNNCHFIYIIFKPDKTKDKLKLPALFDVDKKVVLIPEYIKKEEVNENGEIFAFFGDQKKDKVVSDKLINSVNKASRILEKNSETNLDWLNFEPNDFYKYRDLFGNNVFFSTKIQERLRGIFNVYMRLNLEKDMKEFGWNFEGLSDYGFISELREIYNQQCDVFFESFKKSNEAVYTNSRNKSFWILLVIKEFNDLNNYGIPLNFELDRMISKKGVSGEQYDESSKKIKELFEKDSKQFNYLVSGLVYYLYKMYSNIGNIENYEDPNDTSTNFEFTDDFKKSQSKKKLVECMGEIKKELSFKDKKIISGGIEKEFKEIFWKSVEYFGN